MLKDKFTRLAELDVLLWLKVLNSKKKGILGVSCKTSRLIQFKKKAKLKMKYNPLK